MPLPDSEVRRLFALAASDPCQSFGINNWCYARAMRMAGLILTEGVDPRDLGWATIWSPPQWLHEGARRPVMTDPGRDEPSLKALLGGRSEIVVDGYIFRHKTTRHGDYVVILDRNGGHFSDPIFFGDDPVDYYFTDLNSRTWWDNHVAPTLRTVRGDEAARIVVDPDLAEKPLTVAEWRAAQDPEGQTCIVLTDWDGDCKVCRENSCAETLQALIDAGPGFFDGGEAALVEAVTDGRIVGERLGNPFNPPRVTDEHGRPSVAATFAHFGQWLAPLASFRKWRKAQLKVMRLARA